MPAPDAAMILRLTEALREAYTSAEIEMMKIVARRLQRGISVPGWAERKLAEMSALNRDLLSVISGLNTYTEAELRRLFALSASRGTATALDVLHAGNVTPISGIFTRVSAGALQALYAQAVGQIQGMNLRILRSALDFYRSAVAQTVSLGISGVLTRPQVSQRILDLWARGGLSGFTDVLGKRWNMASYAEMVTRTGMTRSFIQGRLTQFRQYTNYVRIDDSPEECPLCRPWEGRIVTQAGGDPKYPSLDSAVAGGLFHPNCTHSVSPYFVDSGTTLSDAPRQAREGDPDAAYDEREYQRYLERNIRSWKMREAVAVPGSPAQIQAREKVREWQGKTRTFVRETDRPRLYDRESITAGGRRV